MWKINYSVELEIVEGSGCEVHEIGEKFKYPDDIGKMCPWLLDSVNSMVRVLQFGGVLPWGYKGTRYKKLINSEGTTTEFVRCPDPTSAGVVVKIIRKELTEPKDIAWA